MLQTATVTESTMHPNHTISHLIRPLKLHPDSKSQLQVPKTLLLSKRRNMQKLPRTSRRKLRKKRRRKRPRKKSRKLRRRK